jgi:hypothetical protein
VVRVLPGGQHVRRLPGWQGRRPRHQYLEVFRFAGTTAFSVYSLALAHSIWYRRNRGTTLRSIFDALAYALLTAGVFGWLWPR